MGLSVRAVFVFVFSTKCTGSLLTCFFYSHSRWLIFRILLGAGLIKIRGDACWRDLTCMEYHYETQPVPGPTSRWFHDHPAWFHKLETGGNHVVELLVPFMMLFGRSSRIFSGILQILFQLILISSGNLSFLNWLTILPSLYCFDDCFVMNTIESVRSILQWLPSLVSVPLRAVCCYLCSYKEGMTMKKIVYQERNAGKKGQKKESNRLRTLFFGTTSAMLAVVLIFESIPVVKNLLAIEGQQAMNTNFNSWKIVNTYGAFGSITKTRTEIILEGTSSTNLNDDNIVWQPYEFKCKPGKVEPSDTCVVAVGVVDMHFVIGVFFTDVRFSVILFSRRIGSAPVLDYTVSL